ncbi:MAG TPA: DUF3347 domain-containing protein [Chitinophagaceae bacterium]
MTKKIIDIMGIVLPALIIILGIVRVFVQKTKGVNGLTMFFAVLLLLGGTVRYLFYAKGSSGCDCDTKAMAEKVSKHSKGFNQSLENIMTSYYQMTDGFVKNDTTAINRAGNQLKIALDSLKIDELKVDTIIYQTVLQPYANTKSELASIIADPSLEEKRGSLNILSNELFAFVNTARYDMAVLYWMECDKAFGEDKPGNWLSREERSGNPYGQKDCAEVKTKIDHVADTTQKAVTDTTKR